MNKGTATLVWIVLLLALVGLVILAYNSGYMVGSDMAARDNAAEAR